MLQLLPLLGKKPMDLTDSDLAAVLKQFAPNVTLTPDLRQAAMSALQGNNANTVADLIKDPQSVKMLVNVLKGVKPADEEAVDGAFTHRCGHCGNFNYIQ
jgi:hypothetical protein